MQKLPFIFIFLFFCAGINAQTSLVHKVSFTSIGPSVMSGRVVDIDVNPNQPTEFYVAYASGGLWYTKNNGSSFTAVTENAPTQNMGDIAVDWNSETIWIGTGESNSFKRNIPHPMDLFLQIRQYLNQPLVPTIFDKKIMKLFIQF